MEILIKPLDPLSQDENSVSVQHFEYGWNHQSKQVQERSDQISSKVTSMSAPGSPHLHIDFSITTVSLCARSMAKTQWVSFWHDVLRLGKRRGPFD